MNAEEIAKIRVGILLTPQMVFSTDNLDVIVAVQRFCDSELWVLAAILIIIAIIIVAQKIVLAIAI